MKAVILVGGEGTRLRPLTLQRLKSMVPMAGRPFLEYQLDLLRRHGVRDVVLSICHLPEKIRRFYGDGKRYGVRLHYARETTPLGTAGAIKNCEPFVAGGEPVAVLNGDILTNVDLGKMLALHQARRAVVTLALARVADPSAYGLVKQDAQKRVLSFVEKPSTDETRSPWINAGIYIFSPEVFRRIPAGKPYSAERELFPGLLGAGERVWGFQLRDYWMDIGTLGRYLQANLDILEGRMVMLPLGKPWKRRAGIRVGRACRIAPDASLTAPFTMDDGCEIGPGAKLGAAVLLGKRIRIGAQAVLEHCVVWDDVVVGEHSRLNGCVLGDGCRIGRHVHIRPGAVLGPGAVVPDFSRI